MTENSGQWERELVTRLAMAAVREQRRARLWGIFFKLLTFAYLTLVLLLAVDWKGGADVVRGKKHTAMVELNGIIAPGTDASADKVTTALQAAFKDKNTQGVVLRINSPGGSPVQSQTIYDEMRRLRKKYPDIPLYAVVEDICASGGYFVRSELNGIIAPGTDASADKVTTALQAAFKDKNTQGVVLRINSPGGSPVQSQTIYDEMRRLRKKYPDIPLYAVVEDICASGGYFVAAG